METESVASKTGIVVGGGGGTGVAITEVAPTQTMRSEEPKLLPASAAAPVAPAAAAPAPASATTTTTTPPAEDHAIDATTYGIQQQQQQQQQQQPMIGTEQQQPQQPTLQQKQQLVQTQPLMLKVTGAKDKEKSHKRKKNMDSTGQGPPPTAVVKAENTPDVSAAAVTGDLRDEDDDNDEDDDRLLMQEYDPERLKAFNMFVRLFVDENLDRVAPISKQPKEKIQAILEACDRQFPEFHHRSRKRIRTYLKSCRRMRRSKGVNDGKQIRPTLPHLTSAAAETILARACENESNNAKRMRMGLEPLPATEMVMASGQAPIPALPPPPPPPAPAPAAPSATPAAPSIAPQPMPNPKSSPRSKMSLSPHSSAAAITPGIPLPLQKPLELTTQAGSRASPLAHAQPKPAPPMPLEMAHSSPMRQPSPKVAHRPVEQDHVLMQSATLRGALPESELPLAYVTNGSGTKAHVGHTFESEIHPFQNEAYPGSTSSVLQSNEQQQNGPTDLSMKKEQGPLSKSHLNPEEVATIKQLIAGYRESAAFLCRSADELQQLIMQHN